MGAIYEATDLRTSERRALKVLLPSLVQDEEMRARFALEATATVDLDNPHLVEVQEVGVDGSSGAPFFAMELLEGEDAGERLRRGGPLPATEVLAVARQLASGLAAIHEAGIVHRDLKPENMFFVRREGKAPLVKILDLGVAKVIATSTRSAHTTRSLGTPLYMAPEQIEGDARIDERADIYALGQLVYTLLVGVPYLAEELRGRAVLSALLRAMRGRLPPATERAARVGVALPRSFDGWFARSTAPSPGRRFASVAGQVEALAAALDGSPPRRHIRATGAPLALLVLLVALALRAYSARGSGPVAPAAAGSEVPGAGRPAEGAISAEATAASASEERPASVGAESVRGATSVGVGASARGPARRPPTPTAVPERSRAYDPTDFR
jgi:serine/threonine-protein kinase